MYHNDHPDKNEVIELSKKNAEEIRRMNHRRWIAQVQANYQKGKISRSKFRKLMKIN